MTDSDTTAHTGSAAGFDYAAYLLAKVRVDDAALSREVFDAFANAPWVDSKGEGRTWVEFGAGLGTMLLRVLRWLPVESRNALRGGRYLMVDADLGFAERAREFLSLELPRLGYLLEDCESEGVGPGLRVMARRAQGGLSFELHFIEREAVAWLRERAGDGLRADRVLAHTFVDLVDTKAFLAALWPCMNPSAWFWFSSVYEGVTQLQPAHEHDAEVWKAYNASMQPRGGPQHASELRRELVVQGARIERQARADWDLQLNTEEANLAPAAPGTDTAAFIGFIGFILDTVGREPAVHAALGQPGLEGWLKARRASLASGQLSFRAHQLDFVGCAPAPD